MSVSAEILIVGTGVVGSALLEIVRGRLASRVRVVGVANARGLALAPPGEPEVRSEDVAKLLALPRTASPVRIEDETLDRLATTARGVVVDATACEDIGELYERALERGVSVVTANKKPLAGPWAARERLFDPACRSGTAKLRYEATVGAALPVIETLKTFARTGDRVKRIDCVLSGTLGFVCNALADGIPLSQAIAVACERGFTEPDARDDLGGADVARKAVILARESGARLEMQDVTLEPFLPKDLLAASSAETLVHDAAKLDASFSEKAERLRRRNEKLVYLAQIEVGAGGVVSASAGPVAVPLTHPAAQLPGASQLVAFTTVRHALEPLVVLGSGAGGAVTASVLLADIFAATGMGSVPPRSPDA